jgi:hypothetical protein
VLHPLRSAIKVDLDGNRISRLDNDLFLQNGGHVAELLLRNNNITSVGAEFFDNLVSLRTLRFSDNLCANRDFDRTNADFLSVIRANMTRCFEAYEDEPATTLIPSTEVSTLEPETSTEYQTRSVGTTSFPSSSTVGIQPENPETERTFVIKVRGKFVIFDDNGNELLRA